MVHTQYTNPGTPTLLIIPTHLAFPEVKRTPEERVILRTPPENKTKKQNKNHCFGGEGKENVQIPNFLVVLQKIWISYSIPTVSSVVVSYFTFVMFLAFVVEHKFSWLNRRLWGANIIHTGQADKNCWTVHDTTSVPPGSVIQVGFYRIDLRRARREKPTILTRKIFRCLVVAIFRCEHREHMRLLTCYTLAGLWKEKKITNQNNDCNTFLLL